MIDFVIKNWDKLLTLIIALYGALISTYILLKPKSKCRLDFENGFIKLDKENKLLGYCAIRLNNLSGNPIRIQSFGFENNKSEALFVSTIEKSVTDKLSRAAIDFNNQGEVDLGENIHLLEGEKFISPFDTYYVFYDLNHLKDLVEKSKIHFFFSDYNKKRKLKITKKMFYI